MARIVRNDVDYMKRNEERQRRWKARGGHLVDESGKRLSDEEWSKRFREAQHGGRSFRWTTVQPPRKKASGKGSDYCRICKGPHVYKHGKA